MALLDGGREAYPRMLLAIAAAERTVYLEVYAFASKGVGARFVEVLSAAAQRGVQTDVRIDGWGSALGGHAVSTALSEAGCSVHIYNRLWKLWIGRFGRNHRKILLVDDEVAFLGGINIGDENVADAEGPGWADLALEIRGPQVAALAKRLRLRRGAHKPLVTSLRIFLSGLGGGRRLRRRYLKAFAGAERRIDVAHGYFLPDRATVRALTSAARRGVQVRLLLAGRSDVPFALAATRRLYRRLRGSGVTIQEWCGSLLHAKVATDDSRLLLVGSFNLDPFSLANLETLVEVTDPRIVADGESWIKDHFERSPPMPAVESKGWIETWCLDPFGRVVARSADRISRLMAGRRLGKGTSGKGSSSTDRPAWTGRRMARKAAVAVVGMTVLLFGVALLVLPGPAVVVIPIGLAILATEFVWARKLHRPIRRYFRRLSAWTKAPARSRPAGNEDRSIPQRCLVDVKTDEDREKIALDRLEVEAGSRDSK